MKKMKKERKGSGGRPAYDFVLLFKILVLARLFNLSDDQTEYQINDRMSFMRFLGLGLGDRVPDAKTIWLFRDTLTKANVFPGFITNEDIHVYADSAYAHFAQKLPEGISAHICEKGSRGNPLTEEQKSSNREKSRIRCRVEHVFGYMTGSMNGITVRSIGKKRAGFNIGLMNLVYNICRYSILERRRPAMG